MINLLVSILSKDETPPPQPANNIKFIHQSGQSNVIVQGATTPSDPNLAAPIPKGNFWNGTSFVTLDYNNSNGHGVEYSAAYNYAYDTYWTKVYEGSTTLADDWQKGSTNYNNCLAALNAAHANLVSQEIAFDTYFYWNQWEGDANTQVNADAYKANFLEFISDLESDSGIAFDKIIAVRALTTAKTTELGRARAYADNVRAQQESIRDGSVLSSRYELVNIDDVTMQGDGAHYTNDYIDDVLATRVLTVF